MAAVRRFSLAKLANVRIAFSTFDARATSARELMRRVTASKLKEANPKCEVAVEVKGDFSAPSVDITFVDGSTLHIDPAAHTALEMVEQISTNTQRL